MNERCTYKKRRAFTLIELLLALSFSALLMTSLFFWYRHLSSKKEAIHHLKRRYVEERQAYQRLSSLFSHVELPFFTEEGICFRFDRGISDEPRLSGRLLGKLYHDLSSHTLCLGIWPDLGTKGDPCFPTQTVVLLDHIDSCTFSFYAPPNPFQQPVDPEQVGHPRPLVGWQEAWLSEYEKLPALLKICATHQGAAWEIYFDLNQPILYPVKTL